MIYSLFTPNPIYIQNALGPKDKITMPLSSAKHKLSEVMSTTQTAPDRRVTVNKNAVVTQIIRTVKTVALVFIREQRRQVTHLSDMTNVSDTHLTSRCCFYHRDSVSVQIMFSSLVFNQVHYH